MSPSLLSAAPKASGLGVIGRGRGLRARRWDRDAGVRHQRGIDERDQRLNVLLFLRRTLRLLLWLAFVVVIALRQNGPGGAANEPEGDSQNEGATTTCMNASLPSEERRSPCAGYPRIRIA